MCNRSNRGRTYDRKRSDQSTAQRSCRSGAVHIWVMERRRFTREFKLEAVRLIRDRGVSYAQASQDLSVHPTQLRNWVKAFGDDPQEAFPGQGRMKPEQLEIARLKREVIKLKAERDILKKAAAYFAKEST
jgi:transposase